MNKREKEKKIKERRNNLAKLTKDLTEAKKIFEEKNKWNIMYVTENQVILNNLDFI